jgi:hypothetical protein
MIRLAGAVSLTFTFPAPRNLAYEYYSDFPTILPLLPHIEIVKAYDKYHYRLLYASSEFGGYRMHIYCDIRAIIEGGQHMMRILPEESLPPVEAKAGVNSSSARGYFSSRALFFEIEEGTQIEYEFQLESDLPRPVGMRLMPSRVVNGIARQVAKTRMREIAEGFVQRSAECFPSWREHRATRETEEKDRAL